MRTTGKQSTLLDRIFEISISLKGLDGLLEVVGGILLLLLSPAQLTSIITLLTQHELSQDPHDFIATHLLTYAHTLSASVLLFAAAYLLAQGDREDRSGRRFAQRTTLGIPLDDWVPGDFYSLPGVSPRPACLCVADRSDLVRLLCGPAHGARVSQASPTTAGTIHDGYRCSTHRKGKVTPDTGSVVWFLHMLGAA